MNYSVMDQVQKLYSAQEYSAITKKMQEYLGRCFENFSKGYCTEEELQRNVVDFICTVNIHVLRSARLRLGGVEQKESSDKIESVRKLQDALACPECWFETWPKERMAEAEGEQSEEFKTWFASHKEEVNSYYNELFKEWFGDKAHCLNII